MKTIFSSIFLIIFIITRVASAAITVPGADGTDGVLNITEDTVIDLSQAVTATWDQDNSANAGKGVYDAAKWAVVFKYSSVNIDAGVTLTFKNHPSKAPVVWLVSGSVTIEGNVSLNGTGAQVTPALSEPGPGGFRGASGKYSTDVDAGAGFGPGGGVRNAKGGAYGSGATPYGNPSLIPLIGGSGGSGYVGYTKGSGAGGGALLIASTGTVTVNGQISANGGDGAKYYWDDRTGGGSGGGIRVVCSELVGTGDLDALAGIGGKNATAGLGRIRIERVLNNNTLQVTPSPSVVPLADGDTALIWPPASAPTVKILSIGGVTAPDDPRASFGTQGADVALPEITTIQVVIETVGVELASQVQVRLTPRSNGDASFVNAVAGTPVGDVIQWTADIPVGNGYSAIQVKVVRP
jgi:hypothetical protein